MTVEKKVKLTLKDDELEILDKAASVLNKICIVYNNTNYCDGCPLRYMCDSYELWDTCTPHNRLFELINKLKNN